MVMGHIYGLMDENMKATGQMIRLMVTALIFSRWQEIYRPISGW